MPPLKTVRIKAADYDRWGRLVQSAAWAIKDCPGMFCQWSFQLGGDPRRRWGVFYSRPPGESGIAPGLLVATALSGQRFRTRREALEAMQAAWMLEHPAL